MTPGERANQSSLPADRRLSLPGPVDAVKTYTVSAR